ncbi:MAG TPA: hypothetical protein VFB34_12225 [Chloroflexota bacterium]|nr:hypothetical protein [Chloroflexota bacterium]
MTLLGVDALPMTSFIVFMLLFPLGGWYLGRGKGRGVEGALLGLFLSVVGWILVALLPPGNTGHRRSAP